MNNKGIVSEFIHSIASVWKRHPVETALSFFAFVLSAMVLEEAVPEINEVRVGLIPIFASLAFILNVMLSEGRLRAVYYLCWLPMIPLWILSDGSNPTTVIITITMICPTAVLICRRAYDNSRFASDAVSYVASGAIAVVFSGIAFLLTQAVYYSVIYIFDIQTTWNDKFSSYAAITAFTLLAPALLLASIERFSARSFRASAVGGILFNYIVTPALLIYTLILYVYSAKILFTWSLPVGGVANMVFAFVTITAIAEAAQYFTPKRPYERFFRNFSIISLPALTLFWVGTARRISEYGFTEPRVYLLACGLVMTAYIALFFFDRTRRYIYVSTAMLIVAATLAYIPGMSAKEITARSQTKVVSRLSAELCITDSKGRFITERRSEADTALRETYRQLYTALQQLETASPEILADRFDITDADALLDVAPLSIIRFVKAGDSYYVTDSCSSNLFLDASDKRTPFDIDGYRTMHLSSNNWGGNLDIETSDEAMTISFHDTGRSLKIPCDTLLEHLLHNIHSSRAEISDLSQASALYDKRDSILTYKTDSVMVVFKTIRINRRQGGLPIISEMTVTAVLTK